MHHAMVTGMSLTASCLALLSLLLLQPLVAASKTQVPGDWALGEYLASVECLPLYPSRVTEFVDRGYTPVLLPIHLSYSPAIETFAANLIESLVASFGGVPSRGSVAPGRFLSPVDGPAFSALSQHQACKGSSTSRPVTDFIAFDGVCLGLRAVADPDGGGKTTLAAGQTAESHSNEYYFFLRRKLEFFLDVVDRHARHRIAREPSSSGRGGVSLLPHVLLLDADVQLFPGWDRMISWRLACANVSHNRDGRYAQAFPTDRIPTTDQRGAPWKASVDLPVGAWFQRESGKLVNTGVILIDASMPGAACVMREAMKIFTPTSGGDQTAIQRVLRRSKGYCDETGGAQPGRKRHLLFPHSVFPRWSVGAALTAPAQTEVLIEHAHMSGKFKKSAMRRTLFRRMATPGEDPTRLHSGCFLAESSQCASNATYAGLAALVLRGPSPSSRVSLDTPGGPPAAGPEPSRAVDDGPNRTPRAAPTPNTPLPDAPQPHRALAAHSAIPVAAAGTANDGMAVLASVGMLVAIVVGSAGVIMRSKYFAGRRCPTH